MELGKQIYELRKKAANIYYIASFVCYICAMIWFCGSSSSLGIMWLCIGSENLCLGSVWLIRSRDRNSQTKDENSEE